MQLALQHSPFWHSDRRSSNKFTSPGIWKMWAVCVLQNAGLRRAVFNRYLFVKVWRFEWMVRRPSASNTWEGSKIALWSCCTLSMTCLFFSGCRFEIASKKAHFCFPNALSTANMRSCIHSDHVLIHIITPLIQCDLCHPCRILGMDQQTKMEQLNDMKTEYFNFWFYGMCMLTYLQRCSNQPRVSDCNHPVRLTRLRADSRSTPTEQQNA